MKRATGTLLPPLTPTLRGSIKQEYDYKGSGGNKKLPLRRFSTVGIVRKVP